MNKSLENHEDTAREDLPVVDLGGWIERTLAKNKITTQALSAESGLLYAYLSRLINSGKKGKPIRPDQATVRQIGEALFRLGATPDASAAEIAAAYIPKGYHALPEDHDGLETKAREFDADHEAIDYVRGMPEPMQDKALRLLKAAFEEEDAKDNAGNIGKKAK